MSAVPGCQQDGANDDLCYGDASAKGVSGAATERSPADRCPQAAISMVVTSAAARQNLTGLRCAQRHAGTPDAGAILPGETHLSSEHAEPRSTSGSQKRTPPKRGRRSHIDETPRR